MYFSKNNPLAADTGMCNLLDSRTITDSELDFEEDNVDSREGASLSRKSLDNRIPVNTLAKNSIYDAAKAVRDFELEKVFELQNFR